MWVVMIPLFKAILNLFFQEYLKLEPPLIMSPTLETSDASSVSDSSASSSVFDRPPLEPTGRYPPGYQPPEDQSRSQQAEGPRKPDQAILEPPADPFRYQASQQQRKFKKAKRYSPEEMNNDLIEGNENEELLTRNGSAMDSGISTGFIDHDDSEKRTLIRSGKPSVTFKNV